MMQRATFICDDCSATVIVSATADVRRFDYSCTRCSNRGVIAWATALAPPRFETTQLTLFEAAS